MVFSLVQCWSQTAARGEEELSLALEPPAAAAAAAATPKSGPTEFSSFFVVQVPPFPPVDVTKEGGLLKNPFLASGLFKNPDC